MDYKIELTNERTNETNERNDDHQIEQKQRRRCDETISFNRSFQESFKYITIKTGNYIVDCRETKYKVYENFAPVYILYFSKLVVRFRILVNRKDD